MSLIFHWYKLAEVVDHSDLHMMWNENLAQDDCHSSEADVEKKLARFGFLMKSLLSLIL